MTDVYLRYIDDAAGVKIGEFPLQEDALDHAIRLVKQYGCYVDGYDEQPFGGASFRMDGDRAWFEIVVGDATG